MLVDGVKPTAVAAPAEPQEVAAILKEASDERCAVIPYGGGTMMELGAPVKRADLVVSLEKLDRVVDYQPANLTVRVQAGITLGTLNRELAVQGQHLPLDPPFPDRATVGGILASNSSGSLRVRFGSARDLVLGLRVALADGKVVHGGGDVVKNVAGYDLPKLFIGSLGTLGVIVEATFKTAPLPGKTATLVVGYDKAMNACDLALRVLRSPLQPLGLMVLDPAAGVQAGLDNQFALVIRFGGLESAIGQQMREVHGWSRDGEAKSSEPVDKDADLWSCLRDFVYQNPTVLKIGVVPTEIASVLNLAKEVAQTQGLKCSCVANTVGIVLVALEGDRLAVTKVRSTLREAVEPRGGHLLIQRAPREVREGIDVWGPVKSNFGLMTKLKHELDPNGILNPGRFVGGI